METIGPVDLALDGGYRFRIDLAGATLTTDATPPLGEDARELSAE